MADKAVAEALEHIAMNLGYIVRGDIEGPMGFEALALAIHGEGYPGEDGSLAASVTSVGVNIREGLEAVESGLLFLAEAITKASVNK